MTLQDQLQSTLGSAFTVTRELGGGGMSRVFVARDTALNRDIAVKVLPVELAAGVNVDRFRREILLAAALQHPNIVPVLSAGETEGLPYYTMPFVQGESLRARLAKGPLAVHDAVSLLREVARALAYAHERGVVHRDIKPDNVLVSGGSAVVADFGIAKALAAAKRGEHPEGDSPKDPRISALTAIGTSIGTPAYMSPEQAAGDPDTNHRADLYSLGCLGYEVLTGRPPFLEKSPHRMLTAHMTEKPQPVSALRPDVPPVLSDLIAALLEKNPEARPQSAEDVIRVLDSAASSAPGQAVPPILLGGSGMLRQALALYAVAFVVVAVVAKAAIVGVGLPDWVFPGALIVMALGLPVILFTGYTHYTTRRAFSATPTFTPGGTPSMQHGTMATIALKASPHMSWRRTIWGGGIAVGGFVALVGVYMVLRAFGIGPAGSLLAAGRLSARDQIIIGDFTSNGPDSTLGSVITEAVRADVGQSNIVTLMAPTSIAAALVRMQRPATTRLDLATARELAVREGAKGVITGDVSPLGSGYIVTARLVSADSGVTLASFRETADGPKDLLASLGKLTHEIRGKIGESLKLVHTTPPLEQVTTSNIEALRLYAQGTRANNIDGDPEKSIGFMRQALALDSTFASAWRSLAVSLNNALHPRAESDSAVVRAFRYRDRLPMRERLFAEAYYWNNTGRDRAKAAQAYEQMLARDPRDYAAMNNLALIEASRRHHARAESLFAASYAVSKGNTSLGNLVRGVISRGAFQTADSLTAIIEANFPGSAGAEVIPISLLMARRRLDSADAALATARGSRTPLTRQVAFGISLDLAMMRGHLGEAQRLAGQQYAHAETNHLAASPLDPAITMATLAGWLNEQPARASAILDSALAAHPFKSLAIEDRKYFVVARTFAMAGRPDRARATIAQYDAEVRDTAQHRFDEPLRHQALADILMAERKGKEAVDEVRRGDTRPDGPADACEPCMLADLGRAFDLAGQPDSAIATMERYVASSFWDRSGIDGLFLAGTHKRLGELYEAKGEPEKAVANYSRFIELWKTADPSLQPKVAEVKQRLRALGQAEKR